MRRLLVPFTVVVLALSASTTAALAEPEGVQPGGASDPGLLALITDNDVFSTADLSVLLAPAAPMAMTSNATQHYGPYTSGSADSGTCGNDWATDTYDRHFTVRDKDGLITVIEQFKDGSFVTPAPIGDPFASNESPGACETGGTFGTVNPGITGNFHGYYIVPLPAGTTQTSSSPYCDAVNGNNTNCTTTKFIDTHFTPCYADTIGTCPVTTFFFHYSAGDQGLVEHEWQNASNDRGGNRGDIRSTNL